MDDKKLDSEELDVIDHRIEGVYNSTMGCFGYYVIAVVAIAAYILSFVLI